MPFERGHQKFGGKKKGIPNKITRLVAEKLAALKCDPIEGMARIALDKNNPIEVRARCYSELAQYVHPKRKAVELSGPGGSPVELNVSGTELLTRRIAGIVARIGTDSSNPKP